MRLTRVRIAVEPLSRTSARWKRALKGKLRSPKGIITVPNWNVLGKILSPARLQILAGIPALKPKSIAALARSLKRDFKNVYSDIKFLADFGLVDLKEEGKRKTLVPQARFAGIDVDLANP